MSSTKIIGINEREAVRVASELLRAGHVIALPTDTIYGLACNANDQEAIKRLYEIKGRNEEKPVAICVSDYSDLKHWGCAEHLPEELLSALLPGPVTIVLKKSKNLDNPYLNPGENRFRNFGEKFPSFRHLLEIFLHHFRRSRNRNQNSRLHLHPRRLQRVQSSNGANVSEPQQREELVKHRRVQTALAEPGCGFRRRIAE